MTDELKIKPHVLSGSVSRIWEHFKSTRRTREMEKKDLGRREQRTLPHSNIALGIGLVTGIIPAYLAYSGVITLPKIIPEPLSSLNLLLILFAAIAMPIAFVIELYFLRKELKSRDYIIRPEGVDIVDKYLDRGQESTSFENITDVEMEKPLLQRPFKTGNVVLNTSGSDTKEVILEYVKNPETLHNEISDIVSETQYRQSS